MFYKLPEDCWHIILHYVGLKDQMALAMVSESLDNIVQRHWRHIKDVDMDSDILAHFEQQPSQLESFLHCAAESMQSLVLDHKGVSNLRLDTLKSNIKFLKPFSFSNMRSLDWSQRFIEEEEDADKEMLLLAQLFPNLIILKIQSRSTGKHLLSWPHLQELHMIECDSLDISKFLDIFGTLPLRKITLIYRGFYQYYYGIDFILVSRCSLLEELTIDDNGLNDASLVCNLMQLPRFRCLAFYGNTYVEVVEKLATLHPLRVKSLLFNDTLQTTNSAIDLIVRMKNLRHLVLIGYIGSNQIYRVCAELINLKELHLINLCTLPKASKLWKLVETCSSNVLNLSGCDVDDQFLELSDSVLNKVLEKRNSSSSLTLNLRNTKLQSSPEKVIEVLQHPYLKISFNQIPVNLPESLFTEIRFYPHVF